MFGSHSPPSVHSSARSLHEVSGLNIADNPDLYLVSSFTWPKSVLIIYRWSINTYIKKMEKIGIITRLYIPV